MPHLPTALSVCYIVKNEEEFLRPSLESIRDLAAEIIVVDSGSTDQTLPLIESLRKSLPPLHLFSRDWTDDYSAARNFAAQKANCPWILFIDGDEWIDEKAKKEIQSVLAQKDISCFSLEQRNYTTVAATEESTLASPPYPTPIKTISQPLYFTANRMERLYRRESGLQYQGRIHESLIPSCKALGLVWKDLPVILHHFGRLKKVSPQKYEYYLRLSEQKVKEQSEDPASWVELAVNQMELQKFSEALRTSKTALKKFPHVPEVLKVAFQAALRSNEWKEGEICIRQYLQIRPSDFYAEAQLSTALLYQGCLDESLAVAEKNILNDPNSFVAHVNSAVIYFERKNWKAASHHIFIALRQRPDDIFLRNAVSKLPANFQNH